MRTGHCPACGSESIRHAESVPAMECGSCGAVFRKRHAPPREGHALGLLEELREALRFLVADHDQRMASAGRRFTVGMQWHIDAARALLSRADALSPVGELRTCNHVGPFSEGGAAEPQDRERNQLYNAGYELGMKYGRKFERRDVVAVLRTEEDRERKAWNEIRDGASVQFAEARARVNALRGLLTLFERGDHVGASQETAEKETEDGPCSE